ncbi:MAG: hypothetical protein VX257_00865 [Planctomycetota bacterium]|nr:hypothetical protein [Planctomycetota bacterium]
MKLVHDVLLYPHGNAPTPRYINNAANEGICVTLSCMSNHFTKSNCWILELSCSPGVTTLVAELQTLSFPSFEMRFSLKFPDDHHHPQALLLCAQMDKASVAKLPFQTAGSRCASPAVLLTEPDNGTVIGSLVQRTNGIQRDLTGLIQVVKNLTASTETAKAAIDDLTTTMVATKKDVDEANRKQQETDRRLEKLEQEQAILKEKLSKKADKDSAEVLVPDRSNDNHHRRRDRSRSRQSNRCTCATRPLRFGDLLRRNQEVQVVVAKGGHVQTMYSMEVSKNVMKRQLCTDKSMRPGFTKAWISTKDIMIKDACDTCFKDKKGKTKR